MRSAVWAVAVIACGCVYARAAGEEYTMNMINQEAIQECLEGSAAIALVRVDSRALDRDRVGTRSEQTLYGVQVEVVVWGDLPGRLELARWGRGEEMKVGGRYIVAVRRRGRVPLPDGTRLDALDLIEVPPGEEKAAVDVHRRALDVLRGGGRP